MTSSRSGAAPQPGVPPTRELRDRVAEAARGFVCTNRCTPPLSSQVLQSHAAAMLAGAGLKVEWGKYAAVILNNETWRETVAAIPYDRRLLLLPRCLRDEAGCTGTFDEVGLLCKRCGACPLGDFLDEAQRLGYAAIVAEGSPVVTSLLASGKVDAVIGVSCLSMLEQVFPFMEAGAIPGIAIPLLSDGCRNTAVDADTVIEAIHLSGQDRTRRMDLEAIRRDVEAWFTPEAIAQTLGAPASQTERIAQEYLSQSGKRWRPFLTVCMHQALTDPAGHPPERLRPIAMAVECLHKASLIHDDIEDADSLRDGLPTLHELHGQSVAINVGDFLLGEGYRLIGLSDATDAQRAGLLRAAADEHRTLSLGQGQELCWARNPAPMPVDQVLEIFRRKTAPAFEGALRFGAICGGADASVLDVLAPYSRAMGVAYQVRDDADDFFSPNAPTTMAVRPSLPLAMAWEKADGKNREFVESVWRSHAIGAAAMHRLRELMVAIGVEHETYRLVESYKAEAIVALHLISDAGVKGLLRRVLAKIFREDQAMRCCRDRATGHDEGSPTRRNAN